MIMKIIIIILFKMKRTYDDFITNNMSDYIIHISDAIKENKNISLILPKYIGDDIDNNDYLIDNLNIIMDNKLIKLDNNNKSFNFIYSYYSISFHLILEYNQEKEIYRISITII